jgi:protein TonB
MRLKKLSATLVAAMLHAPAYGQSVVPGPPIVLEFAPAPVAPSIPSQEEWAATESGRSAIERGRAWLAEYRAPVVTWKFKIVARIEEHKRYPEEARVNRQQGVAQLFFSVDRQGRVLESRIVRSSGSSILDDEALAVLRRAGPFPHHRRCLAETTLT